MRRRDVVEALACLGSTALAFPQAARAQQRVRRVGVLMGIAQDAEGEARVEAFRRGLNRAGWSEGSNLQLEYRWAAGSAERVRAFAQELVNSSPDAILANSTLTVSALQRITKSVPVVFVTGGDPVAAGFVQSLARPGGNITGFNYLLAPLGGKWLEMLREINPRTRRVAVMFGTRAGSTGGTQYLHQIESAASQAGISVAQSGVQSAESITTEVAALAREPDAGLVVLPDVTTTVNRKQIIAATAQYRVPAVYPFRYVVAEGGLASYGVDIHHEYEQAAAYVARILSGESPSDLPVQGPTKFELALNMQTARSLGLTLPPSLLARADEVVE